VKVLTLFELVREDLQRVEDRMRQAAEEAQGPLGDAILYLVRSGGKRLRPALAISASRFYTVDTDAVISLAASVEMLHTATLVHDDVIDGSLLRRGHPTLNARWNTGATVLAGDYIFARAALFAAETNNVAVVRLFARTLATICDGELRQIFNYHDLEQPKEEYYKRIYSKTASLFATAAESGGILGNAPEEEVRALREYGYNLGMAFQIVDDILDFIGNEDVLGKPVGSDLRQGTITLPVFYYLHRGGDPKTLVRVFNAQGPEEREVALKEALAAIRATPATEDARAEAWEFASRAQQALQALRENPYRAALYEVAEFVVERYA